MAKHVFEVLQNGEHGIIEAGTGVGKSLAYLLPMIYYTVEEGKLAVIATTPSPCRNSSFRKISPS